MRRVSSVPEINPIASSKKTNNAPLFTLLACGKIINSNPMLASTVVASQKDTRLGRRKISAVRPYAQIRISPTIGAADRRMLAMTMIGVETKTICRLAHRSARRFGAAGFGVVDVEAGSIGFVTV
jgi:hypothetical protein